MAINKVKYGNTTLIDLTGTTATADKILTGYGAYGRDGVWINGTAHQGGGIESVTQDQDGYVVLDDDEGNQIIVDSLSVTTNGTYTAATGHAYSPVSVSVTPNLIAKTVTPTAETQIVLPREETTNLNLENVTQRNSWDDDVRRSTFYVSWASPLVTESTYHIYIHLHRPAYPNYGDFYFDDDLLFSTYPLQARTQNADGTRFTNVFFYADRIEVSGGADELYMSPVLDLITVTKETVYDGLSQVTVNGDADLIASNIKSGVDIFGVLGTYGGGGGSGLEYEEGTWTPSTDTARELISFTNTHTYPPIFVMLTDATGTNDETSSTNYSFAYVGYYNYSGEASPSTLTANCRYGQANYIYRGTGNPSGGSTNVSSLTGGSEYSQDYYVSNTGFYPYCNSASRYWRTTRTYKWIAVWGT